MSVHTKQYLHSQIRVGGVTGIVEGKGFRPPAWWFDPVMEAATITAGGSPSHYADFLPISMIRSELFGWSAVDGAVNLTVEIRIPGDHPLNKTPGQDEVRQVTFTVPDWKGVVREDKLVECYLNEQMELASETVMNIASKNFATSSLQEVLIDNVAQIVQESPGDLGVTGAGVLKWGRVAYLEISVPETLHDSSTGIGFRPNLLASTSFDSSVATRYDRTITNVVCDNTHQWALSQSGDKTGSARLKRTKNFADRLVGARQALGILERSVDEFTAILHEWSRIEVSPKQFIKWLDEIVPIPELKETKKTMVSEQGETFTVKQTNTRGHTIALNKRDLLSSMYDSDPRVAPWKDTKLGVGQLINTWAFHNQTMKGTKAHDGNELEARVEGQLMKTMDGSFAEQDEKFLNALDKVLREFDAEGVLIPVGSDKPVSKPRKQIPSNN